MNGYLKINNMPTKEQLIEKALAAKAKKGVESKIKNWAEPTKEEISKLDPAEAAYLERLNKRYNITNSTPKSGAEGRLAKAASKTAYDYENDPEYIKRLDEIHKSTPSPIVTKEQYAELEALHNAAKAADPTASGKETPEAKAFQIAYHKYLPEVATKIIATDKEPTRLAKQMGWSKYDLRGNEEGRYGRRTKQYFDALQQLKPEDKVIPPAAEKPVVERKPFEQNTPIPYAENENAPWWLQDIIKTAGAVGDKARLKKYLPWQATAPVALPEATFYDPTRELAANAEQANIANQTAAAFTDPRQLAAQQAATQGLAGKNAADIMGRYNTMNVGLANQLSQQNASTMNAANQNKANMDTQLFDKYTIANQQFDNSKAKARENIRQSYMDAITNRANTANLNTLYPQYSVDPSSGGFAYFKPNNAPINPASKYDHLDALWEKAKTMDPSDPKGMMKVLLGKGATPDPATGAYEGYNNNPQGVS